MGLFSKSAEKHVTGESIELLDLYFTKRSIVVGLQDYLQPPHEQVPVVPDLDHRGKEFLSRIGGRSILNSWFIVYRPTHVLLERFDEEMRTHGASPNHIGSIVQSYDRALDGLSSRLNDMAIGYTSELTESNGS